MILTIAVISLLVLKIFIWMHFSGSRTERVVAFGAPPLDAMRTYIAFGVVGFCLSLGQSLPIALGTN